MEKVDARDRFIAKHEALNAAYFTYTKKLPIYNRHDGYEIAAYVSGRNTCFIEGREYHLAKNDVSFVAQGLYHGSLVRDRCKFVSIHVKPALIFSQPALIELFLRPFSPDGRFYKVSGKPGLAREIIAFAPFYKKHKNSPRRLVMRLLELMRRFESFPASREQPVSAEKERLKPAVSMMYERFAEPVGVPEMARACALSRAAFYRRFSKVYGENPKAMLNGIRLRHAVILLMNTDKKITEIAFDCGFFSLSNFNRAFMEETGRAPRVYRKTGGRLQPVK